MKTKKHPITLLEIMIVIFLISLIGGVVGYNMKGSLERGRAFKTEQAMSQLEDILQLEAAKGQRTNREIAKDALNVLQESGLVKKPEEFLKDGWNHKFIIKANNDGFEIISRRYQAYCDKQKLSKNENSSESDNNFEPENNEEEEQ